MANISGWEQSSIGKRRWKLRSLPYMPTKFGELWSTNGEHGTVFQPTQNQLFRTLRSYRITYKLCLIMHFVHTSRARHSTYRTVFRQLHAPAVDLVSDPLTQPPIRQAEVQNQVRRARFQLCWARCLEESSAPPSPNE